MQKVESIQAIFCQDFEKLKKLSIDQLKECDSMGRNVFHAVCSTGETKMLNYLIEKLGSESRLLVNSRDNTGNTPAHYASGKKWEEAKYWEKNEE